MVTVTGGGKLGGYLDRLRNRLSNARSVDVGFLEGATYPDGKPVAMIAAFNEFGTSKSPPRPFFRDMIKSKSPEWPRAIADLLKANDYDADRTLDQVGMAVKGQLQQAIVDYVGPPLAPSTVARKGHDKQLVDTGHMLNSVDYRVK